MSAYAKIEVGPGHQGRRMALKDFEFARVRGSYIYELVRGIIVRTDLASYGHAMQMATIREHISLNRMDNGDRRALVLGCMECKLLIWEMETERHPDLAVYLTKPATTRNADIWSCWFPEIVVEVVSRASAERDYVHKREEYWTLGVKEYWIVDAALEQILALRRGRTRWIENALKRGDILETKLLPGFRLPCNDIFDAAGEEEDD